MISCPSQYVCGSIPTTALMARAGHASRGTHSLSITTVALDCVLAMGFIIIHIVKLVIVIYGGC